MDNRSFEIFTASLRSALERDPRTLGEALENLCVLTWSASERNARGEVLSARQYLDGFAVNQQTD